MTKPIESRTRALIRDLSGLSVLLENSDRLFSIDQAIAEAQTRVDKAVDAATAARSEAAAVLATMGIGADQEKAATGSEIAALSTERDELAKQRDLLRLEICETESRLSTAEQNLKATQEELAHIASRIGR